MPTPSEITERQRTWSPRPPHSNGDSKTTKALGALLAVLISTGIVIRVLGGAFFVTREEYTVKVNQDVETKIMVAVAVDKFTKSIDKQDVTNDKIQHGMTEIEKAVAVIKASHERERSR